jgi:DNA ligase N terminus/ATP dependent DNA ligase domain
VAYKYIMLHRCAKRFITFSEVSSSISKISGMTGSINSINALSELIINAQHSTVLMLQVLYYNSDTSKHKPSLSDKSMLKVLSTISNKPMQDISALYIKHGSIGKVCSTLCLPKQQQASYQIEDVLSDLIDLSNIKGTDSLKGKAEKIKNILGKCGTANEHELITNIISGSLKLKIGVKSVHKAMINVKHKLANYDSIMKALETDVFMRCYEINENSEVPIGFMLGRACNSFEEVPHLFSKKQSSAVIIESKLDGERTQIHYSKNAGVSMYSRSFEKQKFEPFRNQLKTLLDTVMSSPEHLYHAY